MPIFVINLDREKKRLAHMTAEMGRRNLDFERIEAIDRQSLSEDIVREINQQSGSTPMDPGSIACFLSHRKAWQRFLDSGAAYVVILEDDVVFGEDVSPFLTDSNWVSQNIGDSIIRLETFMMRTRIARDPSFTHLERGFHYQRSRHFGSAAYLISRDKAVQLLDKSREILLEVDSFMFRPDKKGRMPHGPVFQAVPALFVQDDHVLGRTITMPSDISGSRRQWRIGIRGFYFRQKESVRKRWIRLSGVLFDRIREEQTLTVPFR